MINPIQQAILKLFFHTGLNLKLIKDPIIPKFLNEVTIIEKFAEVENFLNHLANRLELASLDKLDDNCVENRDSIELEVHHIMKVKQDG